MEAASDAPDQPIADQLVFDWTHHSSSITAGYNLTIPYAEYSALKALYVSTHGDSWIWILKQAGIPWNFSGQSDPYMVGSSEMEHFSGESYNLFMSNTYDNASVGNISCTIIALELPAHNITGPIPLEIGNLSNVETLIFERNHVTNPLPDTLPDL
eukprot:gene24808-29979_t